MTHWTSALALSGLVILGSPVPSVGQSAPEPWNGPRVQRLIERAAEARSSVAVDSVMMSYRSEARGYVYFFLDRPDSPDHLLVKADQVALDLLWRAPSSTRQRIVGRRDEQVLPTRIRYHLDHLTVVQDDFGDRIRLGDGDEVAAVVHPVAPGSERIYDFLLADSLTLNYGTEGAEVRVYQIRVRPKTLDRPGYVGTLFVDRATASIVRMNFSFTPSSYVDPYLDYIRISLDNSLWMGRYWLPYRQEVELRREIPALDVSRGSIIRSTFDIRGYDFDTPVTDVELLGPRVAPVSPAARAAFPFERGLFEEVDEEGLAASERIEEVQRQVREVVTDQVMSGLPAVRFSFSGVSDFARYNRAEGIYLGAGLTLTPWSDLRLRPAAGFAFGRERPSASLTAGLDERAVRLELSWDALGDVGGHPGATPLENSITSASGSEDFLDPFFRRGAALRLGSAPPGGGMSVELRVERHRSARDVVSSGPDTEFRVVRPVDEGTLAAASVALGSNLPARGRALSVVEVGRLAGETFATTRLDLDWHAGGTATGRSLEVEAVGALTVGDPPVQALHLIGGRHTLPGQPYRAYLGTGYGLARVTGTLPVRWPYLGIRVFGGVGGTHLFSSTQRSLPPEWDVGTSSGLRGSVGLGLSLGWDTVYIDVAHGVRGGGWEAVFSVSERFSDWM